MYNVVQLILEFIHLYLQWVDNHVIFFRLIELKSLSVDHLLGSDFVLLILN